MKYLFFTFILMLICTHTLSAQSTPEELANMLAEAVNEGNASAVQQLFHPATVAYYNDLSPDALQKQIDALLEKNFPNDYQINITAIENVKKYNPDKDTYNLGGIPLTFTQRPDFKLDIDQTEVDKNKTDRQVSVSSKGVSEMIVKENGRYYIIRPKFPAQ